MMGYVDIGSWRGYHGLHVFRADTK